MQIAIDPEFERAARPLSGDELVALEELLRAEGCRDPLVVSNGVLLDGHHRRRLCAEIGIECSVVEVDPCETTGEADWRRACVLWILKNQRAKRNLTAQQFKRSIGETLNLRKQGRGGDRKSKHHNDALNRKTAEQVAEETGLGTATVERYGKYAETIAKLEDEQPNVVAAIEAKDSQWRVGDVLDLAKQPEPRKQAIINKIVGGEKSDYRAARREVLRDEAVSKISAEPQPLPEGPFRVLVADPPWAYEKRKDDGTHRAALTYPSMTTDEICALVPKGLGHDDSLLWLWTTNAFMEDAYRVVRAWGYSPKTILTWGKDRMGTGDWLRGQTEHCILAVRGRPTVVLTNQTTLLHGPLREHSRKPEEFYALVDDLCPGSKVELFARAARDGWVTWGAESEQFSAVAEG